MVREDVLWHGHRVGFEGEINKELARELKLPPFYVLWGIDQTFAASFFANENIMPTWSFRSSLFIYEHEGKYFVGVGRVADKDDKQLIDAVHIGLHDSHQTPKSRIVTREQIIGVVYTHHEDYHSTWKYIETLLSSDIIERHYVQHNDHTIAALDVDITADNIIPLGNKEIDLPLNTRVKGSTRLIFTNGIRLVRFSFNGEVFHALVSTNAFESTGDLYE